MAIFISCSFDPETKGIANEVQSTLKQNGLDAYIHGQAEATSLPESIKTHIEQAEAMITIITKRYSAWVQNEIGIAYAANVPIYALVQEDTKVEGILKYITTYAIFTLSETSTIIKAVKEIIPQIFKSVKPTVDTIESKLPKKVESGGSKWILAIGAILGVCLIALVLLDKGERSGA